MLHRLAAVALAGLFAAFPAAVPQTTPQSSYTITTSSRLVITDVLVTDGKGRPVHALPQSDFRIFEDGKPQAIRSFDEQAAAPEPAPSGPTLPSGVYSNVALGHLPPTVDVLLIDPFNTDVVDQMYLRLELLRVLDRLAGHAVAVFGVNSGHGTVLMQSFTSDPALLRAAINREIPRLTANGGGFAEHFQDSLAALSVVSNYLSRIPGHKNLLWFSSDFPFVENPQGQLTDVQETTRPLLVHIYNQLSLDRVAVYPIDVKGVETAPADVSTGTASTNGEASSSPHLFGAPDISGQTAMDKIAAATGGEAFYSRNDLGRAAVKAVEDGSDYYTLSYVPQEPADNQFHSIRVEVAGGPYTLHYRSGYFAFADMKNNAGATLDGDQLTKIDGDLDQVAAGRRLARTKDADATDSMTDYSRPGASPAGIVFAARIVPAAQVPGWEVLPPARDAKGHVVGNAHDEPYVIEYAATAHDLDFTAQSGKQHAQLIVAAMASDSDGDVAGVAVDEVAVNFTDTQLQLAGRIGVPLRQQIRLPRKHLYVSLSLIDDTSGHTGSLEVPFTPAKK